MAPKLRFLLVEIVSETHNNYLPTGLCYISSYVKRAKGESVVVEIKSVSADDYQTIIDWQPDIVGFTAFTHTFLSATQLAHKIREALPKSTLFLGGQHITMAPWSMPKIFDYALIGEGEESVTDLLTFIEDGKNDKSTLLGVEYYEGEKLIENPRPPLIEPLDTIPFPDRDAISYLEESILTQRGGYFGGKEHRFMQVNTSRGCPYKCQFCQPTKMWGKFRLHSAEYTAKEIEHVHKTYGITAILIEDDLFTGSKKRVRELVALLEEKGLLGKIIYYVAARAYQIDEEWVSLFKKLGVVRVEFGIESGSDSVAAYLKVDKATVEINKRAITMLNSAGITIYGSFIIGSPPETYTDLLETKKLITWIMRQNRDNTYGVNIATPLPGTGLWDYAVEKGLLDPDNIDWHRLTTLAYEPTPENIVPINEHMSAEELIRQRMQLLRIGGRVTFFGTFHKRIGPFLVRRVKRLFQNR